MKKMKKALLSVLGIGLIAMCGCFQTDGTMTGTVDIAGPSAAPMLRADGDAGVTGVVVDSEAAPIEGVTVFVRYCPGDSSAMAGQHEYQDVTDVDGHFLIEGLPAGEHTLIARKMTYQRYEAQIELEEMQTLEVEIILERKQDPQGFTHREWNGDGPGGGDGPSGGGTLDG
jgi:hypothetical protein